MLQSSLVLNIYTTQFTPDQNWLLCSSNLVGEPKQVKNISALEII